MTKRKKHPIFYKPEIGSIWKVHENAIGNHSEFLFMVVSHGSEATNSVQIDPLTNPPEDWNRLRLRHWVFSDQNDHQYEKIS